MWLVLWTCEWQCSCLFAAAGVLDQWQLLGMPSSAAVACHAPHDGSVATRWLQTRPAVVLPIGSRHAQLVMQAVATRLGSFAAVCHCAFAHHSVLWLRILARLAAYSFGFCFSCDIMWQSSL